MILKTLSVVGLFTHVDDPRHRQGRRHRLSVILTIALTAMLLGQQSLRAIGHCSKRLRPDVAEQLKISSRPEESTIRRALSRLDPGLLDALLGAFTWLRLDTIHSRVVLSFDGKALRGAKKRGASDAHLVEAMIHGPDLVIAQTAVNDKHNEIPTLVSMIEQMVLTDVLVVADAIHTQVNTARAILDTGGDYLFTVKANMPWLLKICQSMPRGKVGRTTTRTRWGGGWVTRGIKVVSAAGWADGFPGAAQIAQVTRTRTVKGKRQTEVVYVICSLPAHQATPAQLAAWVCRHWHIENRVHYVKDVTMGEDAHAAHVGNTHHVLASLRNLMLNLLRLAGYRNIREGISDHIFDQDQITKLLTTRGNK
jgi:predicted transposase YbfD/YdcC